MVGTFNPFTKENKDKIAQLANITDFEKRFQKLLSYDFSGKTQEEIFSIIEEILVYVPLHVSFSKPYNIDGFPIYRVRANVNELENVDLIRTYSYPISTYCPNNGRANISNNPVFYGSDIPGTALAEIKPKVEDIIYLVRWLVRCHRTERHIVILPFEVPESNSFINICNNRYKEFVNYLEINFSSDVCKKAKDIVKFVAEIFKNETPPYPISSCLSHHCLYKCKNDYIIYPSFQTSNFSCNIAFHPNFADEFFKVDLVYKLRIAQTFKDRAAVEVLKIGDYFESSIYWRDPEEADLEIMPKFET